MQVDGQALAMQIGRQAKMLRLNGNTLASLRTYTHASLCFCHHSVNTAPSACLVSGFLSVCVPVHASSSGCVTRASGDNLLTASEWRNHTAMVCPGHAHFKAVFSRSLRGSDECSLQYLCQCSARSLSFLLESN